MEVEPKPHVLKRFPPEAIRYAHVPKISGLELATGLVARAVVGRTDFESVDRHLLGCAYQPDH